MNIVDRTGAIAFRVSYDEVVGYDLETNRYTKSDVVALYFEDKTRRVFQIEKGEMSFIIQQLFDQGIPIDVALRCIRNGSGQTFVFSSSGEASVFRDHVAPLCLLAQTPEFTKDRQGVALCYQFAEETKKRIWEVLQKHVKLPPSVPIAASL